MTLVDIKGVPYLLWETTEAGCRSWKFHRIVPWGRESTTVTLTPQVTCSCGDREWRHGTARYGNRDCKHIHFIRENERC
jgi:hypothetical protein